MPKTPIEKLCELYGRIDICQDCELGKLCINSAPRLRFKFGTEPILLIGLNPGCRVVPGCNHIWGGLDLLRKLTDDERRLKYLDEVLDAVWITNLVKCRKKGNKELSPGEIGACERRLGKEIEWINPKRIIALGEKPHVWLFHNNKDHIHLWHPSYAARRGRGAVEVVEAYIDSLYFQVFARDADISY